MWPEENQVLNSRLQMYTIKGSEQRRLSWPGEVWKCFLIGLDSPETDTPWDDLSANHLFGNCRRPLREEKSLAEKESGSERAPGNAGETLSHKSPIAGGGLLASILLWLLAEWLEKLVKVVGKEMVVLEVGSSRLIPSDLSLRAMVVMVGVGKHCCCPCERAAGFELELATTSPSQSPCSQWPIVLDSFISWAQGWKGAVTM